MPTPAQPLPRPRFRSGSDLVARLRAPEPLLAVELRPPRRDPRAGLGIEHWIDLHHSIRRLSAADSLVFTTDNATGAAEEENLRHVRVNLGEDADSSLLVPFLTSKHPLEYCLRFPGRAADHGHRAVVVLGGDRHDGVARCVAHASELRRLLRERKTGLALGGWANPWRDPAWQVELLKAEEGVTDFVLTQVVSHHDRGRVEAFLAEAERQRLSIPLLFGVFYYRNGRRAGLEALARLMPVPVEAVEAELAGGRVSPSEACARTLRMLAALGVRGAYLSNLPPARAAALREELRPAFRAGQPSRL